MISHVKYFDNNNRMCFKVNDNRLLKQYTKIWKKRHHFNECRI